MEPVASPTDDQRGQQHSQTRLPHEDPDGEHEANWPYASAVYEGKRSHHAEIRQRIRDVGVEHRDDTGARGEKQAHAYDGSALRHHRPDVEVEHHARDAETDDS